MSFGEENEDISLNVTIREIDERGGEDEDDFARAGKHAELLGIVIASTIVLILIMKFLT